MLTVTEGRSSDILGRELLSLDLAGSNRWSPLKVTT